MDVAWFLKQRTSFIRQLYRDATAPFVVRMRLIEVGEGVAASFEVVPFRQREQGVPGESGGKSRIFR